MSCYKLCDTVNNRLCRHDILVYVITIIISVALAKSQVTGIFIVRLAAHVSNE